MKESFPNIVFGNFNFQEASKEDVKTEIINLNAKKSSFNGSILVTILKQCLDIHPPFSNKSCNN